MSNGIGRRAVMLGGAAAVVAGAGGWVWSARSGRAAHAAAIARMTAPLPDRPAPEDLVRYATLAPNGHNTQPWTFRATDGRIAILPDLSRRTPVVDPDDHHLWASLGCAAETLRLAARARGMAGEIAMDAGDGIAVDLTPGAPEDRPRFAAIPVRQSTRSLFDGTLLDAPTVTRLLAAVGEAGAMAVWIDDAPRRDAILDLVLDGNARQFADPAFVAELKAWLRYNPSQAARTGDGLHAACSGNPTLPGWLGPLAFDLFLSAEEENRRYAAQIRSSAGLMVIVAPEDTPAGWVRAGRACQALMLEATLRGLRCAFVNQATEVPEMRAALRGLLEIGAARPSLVLRIGRAPAMPPSLRRPVAEVMRA